MAAQLEAPRRRPRPGAAPDGSSSGALVWLSRLLWKTTGSLCSRSSCTAGTAGTAGRAGRAGANLGGACIGGPLAASPGGLAWRVTAVAAGA